MSRPLPDKRDPTSSDRSGDSEDRSDDLGDGSGDRMAGREGLRWLPPPLRRLVLSNPTFRKLAANAGWLTFERLVIFTVRFGVAVWVVRYLGPSDFGRYSYALSLVGLFLAISNLGLNRIVIRCLVQEEHDTGAVLGTTVVLKVIGGVVAGGLAIGTVLGAADDGLTQLLVVIICGSLVFESFTVPDLWFQAQVRSKYSVWVRTIVTGLVSATKVGMILAGASVLGFAIIYSLEVLLNAVGVYLAFRMRGPRAFRWRYDRHLAGALLRDSWPLIWAGLSVAAYQKIDQVMLGEMRSARVVGEYASAVRLSEVWYFVPNIIAATVLPAIVRSKMTVSPAKYRLRMQALYDVMGMVGHATALVTAALAGPIVLLLFGSEYEAAGAMLRVHIWSLVFVCLGLARDQWAVAENMTRFLLVTAVLGAASNVLLNLVLIPSHGGVGAAWATLISYSVAGFWSTLCVRSLWPVFGQLGRGLLVPFRLRRAIRNLGSLSSGSASDEPSDVASS